MVDYRVSVLETLGERWKVIARLKVISQRSGAIENPPQNTFYINF